MSIITDREKLNQHVKNFVRKLKASAHDGGERLARKGTGYIIDKMITISTPLENVSTPHRVQLVEVSSKGVTFVTAHYQAANTLVLLHLSAQDTVPARVSTTKKNNNQYRVQLDFVTEYDHEVHRLAEEPEKAPKRRNRGMLAWLMS